MLKHECFVKLNIIRYTKRLAGVQNACINWRTFVCVRWCTLTCLWRKKQSGQVTVHRYSRVIKRRRERRVADSPLKPAFINFVEVYGTPSDVFLNIGLKWVLMSLSIVSNEDAESRSGGIALFGWNENERTNLPEKKVFLARKKKEDLIPQLRKVNFAEKSQFTWKRETKRNLLGRSTKLI